LADEILNHFNWIKHVESSNCCFENGNCLPMDKLPFPGIKTSCPMMLTDFKGLPAIGLGTWKIRPEEAYETVLAAGRMGYRHLDCASTYGNEKEIGKAVRVLIGEGVVRREDLWMTSKLPNTAHRSADVRPALEKSLHDLGLTYLDLYLVHWPIALQKGVWIPRKPEHFIPPEALPLEETWQAMESLVDSGLVRHIGVSNFSIPKLKNLEGSRISPAVNQIELHPYLQQRPMLEYCRKKGIQLTAYAPLGSGDRPKPLKKKDDPVLIADTVIHQVAANHQATPAQILLAWGIQRGTSVVAKSVNPARLKENLDAIGICLGSTEMRQIEALDRSRRYVDGSFWAVPGGPHSMESLWDE
jgi:alcohol dehydrogenase (NADP+)